MDITKIYWKAFDTPLGEGIVASTGQGVNYLGLPGQSIGDHLDRLKNKYSEAQLSEDPGVLREGLEQLNRYWRGERVEFSVSIDLQGTSFQRSIWSYLQQISFGQTVTYRQVAQAVGSPRAYQAVGRAVGDNPVPLLVPCHRVIGSDGSLTGFAAGIGTKRWLLAHEGCLLA
jgi:methylated-DNA-[protein]-cysteine S-methyltransferase